MRIYFVNCIINTCLTLWEIYSLAFWQRVRWQQQLSIKTKADLALSNGNKICIPALLNILIGTLYLVCLRCTNAVFAVFGTHNVGQTNSSLLVMDKK